MNNDDLKWVKDLSKGYEWPEVSGALKQQILIKALGVPTIATEESLYDFLGSVFQPKMSSAFACMMILGMCVGAVSFPKAPAEAHTSLYMDSDLMLVQSIVELENMRTNDD